MRLIRLILGDPDPRSTREVDRDIADEIASHVEMIEDELREAGQSAEQARAEAARRFGDIDHYRRLCRRVTLQERLMLQRINLALLIVVMLALGVTAWQSWRGQARTAEAVTHLTRQLEALNTRTVAPAADPASGGVVVITGVIDRAGQYHIPPGGLSLKRALVAAGWGGLRPIRVKIEREGQAAALERPWDALRDGADMPLQNNDLITVYTHAPGVPSTTPDDPKP